MKSIEILNLLKLKKYILILNEYLEIIKNEQVRQVYYKDNKFYMLTDDNYKFIFTINSK